MALLLCHAHLRWCRISLSCCGQQDGLNPTGLGKGISLTFQPICRCGCRRTEEALLGFQIPRVRVLWGINSTEVPATSPHLGSCLQRESHAQTYRDKLLSLGCRLSYYNEHSQIWLNQESTFPCNSPKVSGWTWGGIGGFLCKASPGPGFFHLVAALSPGMWFCPCGQCWLPTLTLQRLLFLVVS